MDLDLALNSVGRLSPLVLPELTRLIAAKKRVLDRWPDILPDPPERDHEAIILQMLALLDSNRWEDVKMSFVLRALKVAFGPNFRNREDVAPIIDFAFAELEVTTQSTFLNAMVAIYLSSYEPKADHSTDLGAKITAKRDLLSGKWRAIEDTYPSLFDANRAHDDVAASMADMDEPWQELKANGFPNPHSTGLMDYVHSAYVDRIRPNLHMSGWLDVLFKWLNPEPGKRKTSGSVEVIQAVLGHWVRKSASDETRQAVTEHLTNQYNDPRTNLSLWVGVGEDYMNVIFSWLTREDLRFFTSVVDATQEDPQWQPRKKFWLQLFDEGLIEHAWVAFCPSAECYARTHLIRSGFADNVRRFGKQSKGGSRLYTSILIMKIGGKIVVDGCHNYRTHIFNVDDPVVPKLFRREYDCDADVMDLAPWSQSHSSIPAWARWVRASIHSKTPMSTKKPFRRSPARDDDLDRQAETSGTPVRTTYQRLAYTPPMQPIRPAAPPVATQTLQPPTQPRPNQTASPHPSGPPAMSFFSSHAVNAEAKALQERVLRDGGKLSGIEDALRKVIAREELSLPEELRVISAIETHRINAAEFESLKAFVEPIFHREFSLQEAQRWTSKAAEITRIVRARGVGSPNVNSALISLQRGVELTATERKAMEYMAQKLRRQGVELLELIRKE